MSLQLPPQADLLSKANGEEWYSSKTSCTYGFGLHSSGELNVIIQKTILNSGAPSMWALYPLRWKWFQKWSAPCQLDLVRCPILKVLAFLQDCRIMASPHLCLKCMFPSIFASVCLPRDIDTNRAGVCGCPFLPFPAVHNPAKSLK